MKLCLIAVLTALAAFADPRCVTCHSEHVAGFLQTGMGRSMGSNTPPDARHWDQQRGPTRFVVRGRTQSIERRGLRASHDAEATIGSGNHAIGYLVRVGEFLFQSPVSWYTRRAVWDVAPGYENNAAPDFNRPVVAECLFCHANRSAPTDGTLNRYRPGAIDSISCERCHGPVEQHLANPAAATIVNPIRLAPALRDAVCEQCHLGGEARVLNPRKTWHDFVPGKALEEVFSVYTTSPKGRFKVVGHAEQLALSRCAQQSEGRMWCGSCHDPHARPKDAVAHYRARCLSCHESARHPVLASTQDCAGCHMPARKAPDSGHAAFTDHRIHRPGVGEPVARRPSSLVPWREPASDLALRNLGLAYVSLGEKEQSLELLREGGRILSQLDVESADAEVLASLGLVRFLQDRHTEAVLLFERALAKRPRWAPYYQKLAAAWKAAGQRDQAIQVLRRGIEIDLSVEALYHSLAELETGAGRRAALQQYLRFNPKSLVAREALTLTIHLRQ